MVHQPEFLNIDRATHNLIKSERELANGGIESSLEFKINSNFDQEFLTCIVKQGRTSFTNKLPPLNIDYPPNVATVMLDGPQGWVQTSSRTDMNNLNRMFLLTPKDLNFMLTEKNCKANGRPNPKITFRIGDTDIKKLPFSVTSDYNSMKIQASV